MKGIAWDDKPEDLERLTEELREQRPPIYLTVVATLDEFESLVRREHYDFAITDLVDSADTDVQAPPKGLVVIERFKSLFPLIIVVSDQARVFDLSRYELPHNVIIKSKSTFASWLAFDIRSALEERGVLIDRSKVFLISGHDRKTKNASFLVRKTLEGFGLKVHVGTEATLSGNIQDSLLALMKDAGAFVAVCTPDDKSDDLYVPRGNVLFELGIAFGLARGPQRSIILQRWGADVSERAELPSNFGGNVTCRFYSESPVEAYAAMTRRLQELRILPDTSLDLA